jgi:hypothetical protein
VSGANRHYPHQQRNLMMRGNDELEKKNSGWSLKIIKKLLSVCPALYFPFRVLGLPLDYITTKTSLPYIIINILLILNFRRDYVVY